MVNVPMTAEQFAAACVRLRQNGIDLQGDSGTIEKDGVTAKYDFNGQRLSVEIMEHPFYYPLSLIEARLSSYFDQSVAYDASRGA